MPRAKAEVQLTNAAERDLKRLGAAQEASVRELLALEDDPERGEVLVGDMRGVRSLHWRCGRVDYRAAYYHLEAEAVCLVFQVSTRENFYREARRRKEAIDRGIRAGLYPRKGDPSEEDEGPSSEEVVT